MVFSQLLSIFDGPSGTTSTGKSWIMSLAGEYDSFEKVFSTLREYLAQPFFRNALIVGVLIALCSSVLGVSLVLKRLSFIGDGLSHVAFGALTVATVVGLTNEMLIVLPVTVLTAVFLLKSGRKRKVMGDASLAMLSVGALGLGYLLMATFGTGSVNSDVCSTLFGSMSILNLSPFELWLCVGMSVAVILFFVLFYNRIFTVTFDPDFSTATGTRADVYNLLTAIVTALIIVLAMNLVGSLLISALVVFPVLSAMRVFHSYKKVVVAAALTSVTSTALGLIAHIYLRTPIGSTIVLAQLLFFLIFTVVGHFTKKG